MILRAINEIQEFQDHLLDLTLKEIKDNRNQKDYVNYCALSYRCLQITDTRRHSHARWS